MTSITRQRLLSALPPLLALLLCPLVAQLAPGDEAVALAHARKLAELERDLGLYAEPGAELLARIDRVARGAGRGRLRHGDDQQKRD